MKAKRIHHGSEWIDREFDPPTGLAEQTHLVVWHEEKHRSNGDIILKLAHGAGIWDKDGNLVFYGPRFGDLSWLNNSDELLCIENVFGSSENEGHVGHVLKRFGLNSFSEPTNELRISVPTGGANYLVTDHKERTCLISWLDQSEWGYILVDLKTMTQTSGSFQFQSPTLSPPKFSPDDSVVVSCNVHQAGWWTSDRDEYWDSPSEGGLFKVGTISTYDVLSERHSNHDIFVDLPKGWLPDNADSSDWDAIWGPEFISNSQLRIWLPGGNTKVLDLPLPEEVICSYKALSGDVLH